MARNTLQDNERLYFAYGSNLSTTQMRNRCLSSTPIGLAHLSGWTWIINERGYANVVQHGHKSSSQTQDTEEKVELSKVYDLSRDQSLKAASGPGVYGLVYRLHPNDEAELDRCEGVGYAYEREMLDVEWVDVSNSNTGQGSSIIATGASTEPIRSTEETEKQLHEETRSLVPGEKFEALVYVDFQRITPSVPKDEYVGRMNLGIEEASGQWGLPLAYVNEVIRPYIPAHSNTSREAAATTK